MLRATKMRQKEVINITTGVRLGYVSDVEVNFETGKIDALIVPARGKFFCLFSKETEHIIPWKNIIKIGDDIILISNG